MQVIFHRAHLRVDLDDESELSGPRNDLDPRNNTDPFVDLDLPYSPGLPGPYTRAMIRAKPASHTMACI